MLVGGDTKNIHKQTIAVALIICSENFKRALMPLSLVIFAKSSAQPINPNVNNVNENIRTFIESKLFQRTVLKKNDKIINRPPIVGV